MFNLIKGTFTNVLFFFFFTQTLLVIGSTLKVYTLIEHNI